LKVTLNSLGHINSLPIGSLAVGSPPFSLWTGVFCRISPADDWTVTPPWLGRHSLVIYSRLYQGQVRMGFR